MGKLGEGAFGQVQRAIHLASGDEVAIKIIERSQLTTPRQCRNAEREVRLMSLLHHPNIVSVREIRVLRDRYVIVMERSKGGELFDYIVRSGRLCEPTARSFFRQIVSAVRYCHEVSVCGVLDATSESLVWLLGCQVSHTMTSPLHLAFNHSSRS
jgi:serine/threonine protein kinase